MNHCQDPEPEEPEDIERAWAEELSRRSAELDSGAVEGIPLKVVSAEVRALLKGSHPHAKARREASAVTLSGGLPEP